MRLQINTTRHTHSIFSADDWGDTAIKQLYKFRAAKLTLKTYDAQYIFSLFKSHYLFSAFIYRGKNLWNLCAQSSSLSTLPSVVPQHSWIILITLRLFIHVYRNFLNCFVVSLLNSYWSFSLLTLCCPDEQCCWQTAYIMPNKWQAPSR